MGGSLAKGGEGDESQDDNKMEPQSTPLVVSRIVSVFISLALDYDTTNVNVLPQIYSFRNSS